MEILKSLRVLTDRIEKIEKEVQKIDGIKEGLSNLSTRVQTNEETIVEIQDRNRKVEESVEKMGQIVHTIVDKYSANAEEISQIKDRMETIGEDNGTFSNIAIKELKADMLDLKCRSMSDNLVFSGFQNVYFVGDFNARTGSEDDFIFVPDSESHVVDIENIQINAVCNLDQYDFSRKRNSRDKNKNRFGNQLLEFCKGNNFFIMNGRTLGDIDGKFTCRNSSVVDYCLCSAELIQNFTDFKVLDFSSLYSDVHSPIEISLKTNRSRSQHQM
ncbi:Hypothetical predicted protein [Mytilus galloprovincialis]|uniref:Endonuclease/exonuclease/phosphatase domain-containing protein n=1 Tax=Mytilus galloprovincialis TaxID=29158 RepID=A0A8B6DDS2_MYTGA|nr:Hypothetical predicted protein [Mytilus galloprovincialis]